MSQNYFKLVIYIDPHPHNFMKLGTIIISFLQAGKQRHRERLNNLSKVTDE